MKPRSLVQVPREPLASFRSIVADLLPSSPRLTILQILARGHRGKLVRLDV